MTKQEGFLFASYVCDLPRGTITFRYELTHGGKQYDLTESLVFLPPSSSLPEERRFLIDRIARQLHLALGMSYWKLFCPREITVSYPLSMTESRFFETLYTKGLGEFFYRNTIDFRGLVRFPSDGQTSKDLALGVNLSNRSLVLSGAGKDSIVTGELLRKHGDEFELFTLNPTPIHEEVARIMGVRLIQMRRIIDPLLFELNKTQGAFNGHVPVTSIFMFSGMLAAALYDFRYVIASNEESANYGNVEYLGAEMNHQWSKSLEFETILASHTLNHVSPDMKIFSLLRPFTELEIARIFSQYPQYFHAFTSCNANFKITGNPRRGQWCGKCPKCAFVFLLLSSLVSKETVTDIFQQNLLDDPSLIPTYRELLGIEGFKPFECVGTPQESVAAFLAIQKRPEWARDAVVEALKIKLKPHWNDDHVRHHFVPPEFDAISQLI